MSITAMKLAADTLERYAPQHGNPDDMIDAITALCTAIEAAEKQDGWVLREVLFDEGEPIAHREPEKQEPVAYLLGTKSGPDLPYHSKSLVFPDQKVGFGMSAVQAHQARVSDGQIHETVPLYTTPAQQAQREPLAWADEIIYDLNALFDSEMITENDSGDALIRLDAAICAVEEAEERHTTPLAAHPAPGYCKHCKQYTIEEPLPAAQRQPLTKEQIELGRRAPWGFNLDAFTAGARFAEAAHGIKENT